MIIDDLALKKSDLDDMVENLSELLSSYASSFDASQMGKVVNGLIFAEDYPRYRQVVGSAAGSFFKAIKPLEANLQAYMDKIEKMQPKLQGLIVKDANMGDMWPEVLRLGEISIAAGDKRITVPNITELPLLKPVYQLESDTSDKLQRLLLRILFACPMGKVQFMAFDKENYGDSLGNFKILLELPEVFPQKKVITDTEKFKEELTKLNEEINMFLQKEFPKYKGCKSWRDYNNIMLEQGQSGKCLPYRIVCYFGIHTDDMVGECFSLFRRLATWGPRVGILPVFSFEKGDIAPGVHGNVDRNTQRLIDLCEISKSVEELMREMPQNLKNNGLSLVAEADDEMPSEEAYELLLDYRQELENNRKPVISFKELLSDEEHYSRSSKDGIFIPMGSSAQNGSVVELRFGDPAKKASPHALVGGITGSGKSNLLHVIISSASWYYAPDELNIYLLDFKDGVEFAAYAENANHAGLPQAKLVAVESDAEYGVTVLQHLDAEQKRRNNIFSSNGVKDYYNYRKLVDAQMENQGMDDYMNDLETMPRILVIVDEFQRLLLGQGAFERLLKLAQQGRSAGIHLLLCAQSLSGLDFGQAEKQFQARIALKCLAEDSARLLGSYNNIEAVGLEIPYAIMNTAGSEAFNVKYAVPEAKPEAVAEIVEQLNHEWIGYGRELDMKVFSGAKLPILPDGFEYESYDDLNLTLGECLNYNSSIFRIALEARAENNILLYGDNRRMRVGLMASLSNFVEYSNGLLEEIVYIGEGKPVFDTYISVKTFEAVSEFLKIMGTELYSRKRLIIMDNCNLVKDIGFGGFSPSKEGKQFKEFIEEVNKHGSYIVAFHESINAINEMGSNYKKYFGHKIAFDKVVAEIQGFFGMDVRLNSKAKTEKRAIYCHNGKVIWFRPYVHELMEGERE